MLLFCNTTNIIIKIYTSGCNQLANSNDKICRDVNGQVYSIFFHVILNIIMHPSKKGMHIALMLSVGFRSFFFAEDEHIKTEFGLQVYLNNI